MLPTQNFSLKTDFDPDDWGDVWDEHFEKIGLYDDLDYDSSTATESVPDSEGPHLSFQGIDTDDPGGHIQHNEHKTHPQEDNFEALRPFLGWAPVEAVKNTIKATTRYAREPHQTYLKKHFKSRFPALNVPRRNEPVATDTIYSDTPAIGNGATKAQLFVGRNSLLSDVYSMKSESEFPQVLEEVIRQRGAMNTLVSDSAKG